MWGSLAVRILKFGFIWLSILIVITVYLGWQASNVKLSYEFSKAIPTDDPKYKAYLEFQRKFGEDGNLLVIGIETDQFFLQGVFNDYIKLVQSIRKVQGVTDVISIPTSVNLVRSDSAERLKAIPLFPNTILSQQAIDTGRSNFLKLPFYKYLLYNPYGNSWLMGISINSIMLNSPKRTAIVNAISTLAIDFGKKHNIQIHLSGLPLIRTVLSDRIQKEMKFFLAGSVLLSAFILLLFFRSLSTTLLSLAVVITGVIWSVGFLNLFGYKITILTALIPPLVVVIGIPNCIYFLNKYHSNYREFKNKKEAILAMISKMGVVTLFCNIAAAIGFAVFALTKSAILKEFGAVAGLSIMMLFFISLILIPVILNYLPAPKSRHTKYLDNKVLQQWLDRLERWALNHKKQIFAVTIIVLLVSFGGITRLKSVGYIVDDLPKTDKIYTDLKFFEKEFKGVMPLEIIVDTKKRYGVTRNLKNLIKVDSLCQYLFSQPYIGRPLAITEGLKFVRQAFFDGDSAFYAMPEENDLIALKPYLSENKDSASSKLSFGKLISSFMDKNKQQARISASMMDVGTARLPGILDSVKSKVDQLFDSSMFNVQLTGASVTFLQGNRFIINGLKDSILWAFSFIALCMLYLFKSWRILLCSLLPNVIPMFITAGIMGWAGVSLKPSTVLVFSVTLGIAIDITIRFLVNYKQQLDKNGMDPQKTVIETIHSTGISIVYTSIVLIVGFIIFCFSSFGGTIALGWLTSVTLVTATIANLVLLPALILIIYSKGE